MGRGYYLPGDDLGKADLLEHLLAKLPTHAEVLGISSEDLNELKNDAAAFRYALNTYSHMQSYAKQWTGFKDALRDGDSRMVLAFPAPPALPTPIPEAVTAGVVQRLMSLVARIKASRRYTEYIGKDLGLVGSEQIVDTGSWRPVLQSTLEGGRPVILWNKGKADALEIWAQRDANSSFSFFTISTDPRFTDPTPNPASSALWHYKAIYRIDDKQVGQWSDTHTVVVGS